MKKKNKSKKAKVTKVSTSKKIVLLNLALYVVGIHSLVLYLASPPGQCAQGACQYLLNVGILFTILGMVNTFYIVNTQSKTNFNRLLRAIAMTILTLGAFYWYLALLIVPFS